MKSRKLEILIAPTDGQQINLLKNPKPLTTKNTFYTIQTQYQR